MSKPIGVTIHHEDQSTLKVPIADLAAALAALQTAYQGTGRGGRYTYLNADECPVHGPWRAVQGGVSKSTGKPYDAFWTCDTERGEERCTNKPSKEWVETHPPHMGGAHAEHPTDEFSDLPF